MIIKKKHKLQNKTKLSLNYLLKNLNYVYFAWFYLTCIILVLAITLKIFHRETFKDYYSILYSKIPFIEDISQLQNYPFYVYYSLKSFFESHQKLKINIKFKDYKKINFMRELALNGEKEFSYVPAIIENKGEKLKAKIRLKGDRDIHYKDLNTSSYRIEIKNDKTFLGMSKFSIHKPVARNYIREWIYLKMNYNEGIVTPRYKFIELNINGQSQGLYAIEEHYTKHLIEYNNRKEGPIIRFNENYGLSFENSRIEPYQISKEVKNSEIMKNSVALLETFRNNLSNLEQVFDVEKLGKFFAIIDLNGTFHAAAIKSMRFYYNPVTALLEPIPFDGHGGGYNEGNGSGYDNLISSELGIKEFWMHDNGKKFYQKIFNDHSHLNEKFYNEYFKMLRKLSDERYLNTFFDDYDSVIKTNLNQIYSEFPLEDRIFHFGPGHYKFHPKIFYLRQKMIRSKLKNLDLEVSYLNNNENTIMLKFESDNLSFPIEILGLKVNEKLIKPEENNIIIPKKDTAKQTQDYIFTFKMKSQIEMEKLNEIFNKEEVEIKVKYYGDSKIKTLKINKWRKNTKNILSQNYLKSNSNFYEFDFIKRKEGNVLFFVGDSINVNEKVIIPSGYVVKAKPGTTLNLTDSSFIISKSPFIFKGMTDNLIKVISSDQTAKGLFLYQTGSESYFSNTTFKNLSNFAYADWELPGAITFYEANVFFNFCNFKSNLAGDDYINIIRSDFKLINCKFIKSFLDGFDSDFSNGLIRNTSFLSCGNDGIDLSGSIVSLENVTLVDIGDKSISVGEKSYCKISNIHIKDSVISISSKDSSQVFLSHVNIEDSKYGFTAFQKKYEYGPGFIEISNYELNNVQTPFFIEEGSRCIANGSKILTTKVNLRNYFYN